MALHRVSQRGFPVVFAGAGLPQVARLAGNAKSYAERLFQYPAIGALSPNDAALAIRKPVEDEGAAIAEDALDLIVERTRGYPFFLQEWGAAVWNIAESPEIDLVDAEKSYAEAISVLDSGFFKVRLDRLTPAETAFVETMAALGEGPYQMADVAASLKRTQTSLGPTRAGIIRKGMIYSVGQGVLDFTVPLFAEYLRRHGLGRRPDKAFSLITNR